MKVLVVYSLSYNFNLINKKKNHLKKSFFKNYRFKSGQNLVHLVYIDIIVISLLNYLLFLTYIVKYLSNFIYSYDRFFLLNKPILTLYYVHILCLNHLTVLYKLLDSNITLLKF